jgi:hypothetical protein
MEREGSRRRAGDDRDDPEAAESTLGKDCAIMDASTKMTEEFDLTDLSNGPVVEAVHRSCRCASHDPEICLLSWLPKYRVPFWFTSHWVQGTTVSIDYPKYGFDRTRRSLKQLRNNFTASCVSS